MTYSYRITSKCLSCGTCLDVCKFKAIKIGFPYRILDNCKRCGKCYEACPVFAIVREITRVDSEK